MRVLHVVESMGSNAVEAWLARMYLYGLRAGVDLDWTFYCQSTEKGSEAERLEAAGARIIPSPWPLHRTLPFMLALRREVRSGGYDVLHMHHDIVNGVYVAATLGSRRLRRICHIHNADENTQTAPSIFTPILRGGLRRLSLACSSRVVGISEHTLERFLAGRPRRQPRDLVHYYGIDPEPFVPREGLRARVRHDLGIAEHRKVLLFAGRMVGEKNPLLAIDAFHALRHRRDDCVMVFAGEGGLRDDAARRAEELGVDKEVIFLGWRDDVADLMRSADLFLLLRPDEPPEGLGIAVVEAQLAGSRLLLSTGIKADPLLPGSVFMQLPAHAEAERWAAAADQLLQREAPSAAVAHGALAASPFDMSRAFDSLTSLHRGEE